MKTIGILKNTVQDYAWGSVTAIPQLLGMPVTGGPQAELWMGAHPRAPSLVCRDGRWESLLQIIDAHPEDVLGKETAGRFGAKLPFLFKVLAAARPLSIQAHPNAHQAREGFDRENRLGISLAAANRNYRDGSHKPECICGLTPFWAMAGFREISEMRTYLTGLCGDVLKEEIALLKNGHDADGLKRLVRALLTMPEAKKAAAVSSGVFHAGAAGVPADPVYAWVLKLHAAYPADLGVLFPAILNLIRLEPGQALYLASGQPHAYLEGAAIELMANSDNVLRGGLTGKHLDVAELLKVLSFRQGAPAVISPRRRSDAERIYDTPAEEFSLSVISVFPEISWLSPGKRSAEILLCTQGRLVLESAGPGDPLALCKGVSALVPASVPAYRLHGGGVCYRASVPGPEGFVLDMRRPSS